MKKTTAAVFGLAMLLVALNVQVSGGKPASFSPYVDAKGAITLPADFRGSWAHLGTWALTSAVSAGPELAALSHGTGLHGVYTQPGSLKAYKQTGRWPDGAVLVLEAHSIRWDDLPTGHVMLAGEAAGWWVMVRDGKGRFKDNPTWGDGWGWAFFKGANPGQNASKDCRNDCLGCHAAAPDSAGVFVQGYPALR
jgi:hypothetical protein